MRVLILFLLGLTAEASAPSSAFLYTEAPQYDIQAMLAAGERFPGGAAVKVFSGGASRLLAPSLTISADAALSADAEYVLVSGKQKPDQPWQIDRKSVV